MTTPMTDNYQDAAMLTLSHADAKSLTTFCQRHRLDKVIVARNDGVYVGANGNNNRECVFFFPGCNPATNPDWEKVADAAFGADEFGEMLPLSVVADVVRLGLAGVRIHVTEDDVKTHYFLA